MERVRPLKVRCVFQFFGEQEHTPSSTKEKPMYLQQLFNTDQGRACYLVGDTDAAVCAVVDPPLDMVDDILEQGQQKGFASSL
jgi:hypothetical protein